jgi:cell division protein FtsQ
MTDHKNEIDRAGSTADPGRARQRRLKRDGGIDVPSPSTSASRHRGSDHRAIIPDEATIKERLASANVKLPANLMPSLQVKLSSKLMPGKRKSAKSHSTLNTRTMENGIPGRSLRRKGEPKRKETMYEATDHSETQRISNPEKGFLPRKKGRVFEARGEASPPVMVRGGMGGMAFGRVASSRLSKQKPPRRRIDVPLNAHGAEMRLPAVPYPRLGWRAISLLMVMMMVASLFLIWKAPVFQVTKMQAEGLKRLTVSDLNAVMRATGKSVFTINPKNLDQALHQAFPELAKISIKLNLPASVKVVVTEREPIISWVQDGNETWVDADGVSFPPRGETTKPLVKVEGHGILPGSSQGSPADSLQELPDSQVAATTAITPTITPTLKLSPELITAILALGEKMPADTLLVYDSVHGLGWNDPKGWEVFFGSEDQDMEMKLSVYQALVSKLESEGIQPALISVEYVHAPYYRMER